MRITELNIRNIRGISALDLKLADSRKDAAARAGVGPEGEWVVIAGANGTGKTTILRAIAAVCAGPDFLPRMQIDSWDWISMGEDAARATLRLTQSSDDLVPKDDDPAGQDTAGDPDSGPVRFGIEWTSDNTKILPPKRNHSFLHSRMWSQHPGSRPAGWMVTGLGASRTRAPPTSLADEMLAGIPRRAAIVTLFRSDATLRLSFDWVQQAKLADSDSLGIVERVIEPLLASLGELVFEEPTEAKVKSKGIFLKRRESFVGIAEVGMGAESLCASVCEILHRMYQFFGADFLSGLRMDEEATPRWLRGPVIPRSGVVLLDEAENHLHPALQQRLGPWLRRRFPNIQFIVTTHSPYIAQGADRLFVLGKNASIDELRGDEFERVVNGSVDDAVTGRLFGFDNPYSLRAQKLRTRLGEIERRMQRNVATEAEVAERVTLLDQLPSAADHEVAVALERLRGEP